MVPLSRFGAWFMSPAWECVLRMRAQHAPADSSLLCTPWGSMRTPTFLPGHPSPLAAGGPAPLPHAGPAGRRLLQPGPVCQPQPRAAGAVQPRRHPAARAAAAAAGAAAAGRGGAAGQAGQAVRPLLAWHGARDTEPVAAGWLAPETVCKCEPLSECRVQQARRAGPRRFDGRRQPACSRQAIAASCLGCRPPPACVCIGAVPSCLRRLLKVHQQ